MSDKIVDLLSIRNQRDEEKARDEKEHSEDLQHSATQFTLAAFSDVLDVAMAYGHDPFNNPESVKDLLLAMEALRGFLLRTHRESADIQRVSDELFPVDDPKQELRKIIDKLNT